MGEWEMGRMGEWVFLESRESREKKSAFYLLITYYLNLGWGEWEE